VGSRQDPAWRLSAAAGDEWGAPGLPVAVGLLLWEAASRGLGSRLLPSFSSVAAAVWQMARHGALLPALAASLGSLAAGLLAAIVLGVGAGLCMARSDIVEHAVEMYFDALMAAPTLVYVPVLFALFGVTRLTQVVVIFLYGFFVIAATTLTGIRAVDRRLVDMARAFGASERQIFWTVALPAAGPFALSGLRLGTMRAVKGMVVGEMIIALSGLGALLKTSGAQFDLTRVLAVLLVIVVVSLAANLFVAALARRVLGARFVRPPAGRA
jgi:NitT/TauT family transport system permease protein